MVFQYVDLQDALIRGLCQVNLALWDDRQLLDPNRMFPACPVSPLLPPSLTLLQGELEHRRVKRFYTRTNKIKFTRGIAMQQRRERLLHRLQDIEHQTSTDHDNLAEANGNENQPFLHFVDKEPLPYCSPEDHYQMSSSQKHYWDISAWLHKNRNDVAIKVGARNVHKATFSF